MATIPSKIVGSLCVPLQIILVQAGPIPFLRNPLMFTSGLVFEGLVAVAFLDNFVMLYAAGNVPLSIWLLVTFAGTGGMAVRLVLLYLGGEKFRWLAYTHYTAYDHFKAWIWENALYHGYGMTLDDHRARALETIRPQYWSKCSDDVQAWVENGWEDWEASPPIWFTQKWKRTVTEGLGMEMPQRALENTRSQQRVLNSNFLGY